MDEEILSSKLSRLQEEVRNFHKKISPAKKIPAREGQLLRLTYPEDSKVISSCISALLALAKVSVCVTGPTVFPTIIYCIEGSSQLFWQATAISGILVVLLTTMVISMVCVGVRRVRDTANQLLNTRVVRYFHEVTSSDFAWRNSGKVVWPVVVVSATSLVALFAHVRNLPVLLNGSVVLVGFAAGILAANVCHLLNNPAVLPVFHSPKKVLMRFASPTPRSKKSLDFSQFGRPRVDSGAQLLSSSTGISPGKQTLSMSPRVSPGTQSLPMSPRVSPGTQSLSMSPRVSPGAQSLSMSPRVSPGTQSLSMSPRVSPGTQSLSMSPRVSPGSQLLASSPAITPGTQSESISPGIRPEIQLLSSSLASPGKQLLSTSPRASPGAQQLLSPSPGSQLYTSCLVSPGTQFSSTSLQDSLGTQLMPTPPLVSPKTQLQSYSPRASPGSQMSMSDAYYDCVETQSIEAFLTNVETNIKPDREETTQFLKLPFSFNLNFLGR